MIDYLEQSIRLCCPRCDEKVDSIDKLSLMSRGYSSSTVGTQQVHCRHFAVGCGWTDERDMLVEHLVSECKVSRTVWLCVPLSA